MRFYQKCAEVQSKMSKKQHSFKSILYSYKSVPKFKSLYSISVGIKENSKLMNAIYHFTIDNLEDQTIRARYESSRGKFYYIPIGREISLI